MQYANPEYLRYIAVTAQAHHVDRPGQFGPLLAMRRNDGMLEGLYRFYKPTDPAEPYRVYAIDGTPSFLDARQSDFHWTHSSIAAQFLEFDAHGLYMSGAKFFNALNTQRVSFAVLPSSEEGLFILTQVSRDYTNKRMRYKSHPTVVTVRHVRSKVESFQRPNPREIISLQVGLRIEGAGYFNLKDVLTDYVGMMDASSYLQKSGLSSVLFRDFEEFSRFFQDIDGPHQLTLEAAQLTCRYHQDNAPMLSSTQRWGASHEVFEAGPEIEGEQRFSLGDENGKLLLHMRMNVQTGDCSVHYFTGVGAMARDRMSVVDIEFTLRDPRQAPILDDQPESHIKASVLATTTMSHGGYVDTRVPS